MRAQAGLTLIEIVIVLIILSLIMTTLLGRLWKTGETAKVDLTKLKMTQVKGDVEQFRLRYNDLPSSLDDLVRCTEKTGSSCLPITDEEGLKDAWGTSMSFQRSGDGNQYVIRSLGADKREGGDGANADITLEGP